MLIPSEIVGLARQAPPTFKRVVATDADGTLWATDVGDLLFQTLCRRGDIRGRARSMLVEGARALLGHEPPRDFGALGALLMERYAQGDISIKALCDLQAECIADRSREDLDVVIAEVAAEGARLFRPEVRALLAEARRHGFAVHVVSGSLSCVVRATLERAGVRVESVSGGELVERDGWVHPELDGEIPLFEGKSHALERQGARPAALGLGDGGWDAPFLSEAHVPVLVYPTTALVAAMHGREDALRIE